MTSLLNRSAVKRHALQEAQNLRGSAWRPTRVSASFLDAIEREVKRSVRARVLAHPGKGKTLQD